MRTAGTSSKASSHQPMLITLNGSGNFSQSALHTASTIGATQDAIILRPVSVPRTVPWSLGASMSGAGGPETIANVAEEVIEINPPKGARHRNTETRVTVAKVTM